MAWFFQKPEVNSQFCYNIVNENDDVILHADINGIRVSDSMKKMIEQLPEAYAVLNELVRLKDIKETDRVQHDMLKDNVWKAAREVLTEVGLYFKKEDSHV